MCLGRFDKGEVIVKPGDHFDSVYFIYKGTVLASLDPEKEYVFRKHRSGSWIGDFCLLDCISNVYYVNHSKENLFVLQISFDDLRKAFEKFPIDLQTVLARIARKKNFMEHIVKDFTLLKEKIEAKSNLAAQILNKGRTFHHSKTMKKKMKKIREDFLESESIKKPKTLTSFNDNYSPNDFSFDQDDENFEEFQDETHFGESKAHLNPSESSFRNKKEQKEFYSVIRLMMGPPLEQTSYFSLKNKQTWRELPSISKIAVLKTKTRKKSSWNFDGPLHSSSMSPLFWEERVEDPLVYLETLKESILNIHTKFQKMALKSKMSLHLIRRSIKLSKNSEQLKKFSFTKSQW